MLSAIFNIISIIILGFAFALYAKEPLMFFISIPIIINAYLALYKFIDYLFKK